MLKKEGDKIVCREFSQKDIYRIIKVLEKDTIIYCTDKVIADFEAFVSINMRIRRVVNTKNITLQKIPVERKAPEAPVRKRSAEENKEG